MTYLMPSDWEERVVESGAKFYGYKNHRQLAEQIKNAYATAESIVEQFDFIIYEQFFFLGKHLLYLKNYKVDLGFMDMLLLMYCLKDFRIIVQG